MKSNRIVVGILADVDAGKTTLSEEILYRAGIIKAPGRVDRGDAFLDRDEIERRRGITVFAKEAGFSLGEREITLIDTPGHRDFNGEVRRSLSVLDMAVLLLDGSQRISGYSISLWQELERLDIPTIVFINKADLSGFQIDVIKEEINGLTHGGAGEYKGEKRGFDEEGLALTSEEALEIYDNNQRFQTEEIRSLIEKRKLFPLVYGAALKGEGIEDLLSLIETYGPRKDYPEEFGALVYKITRDDKGQKLTHLKITGGILKNRTEIEGEKITSIMVSNQGENETRDMVEAGQVCLVTGLSSSFSGQGLGMEESIMIHDQSVLSYSLILPHNVDYYNAFKDLKELGEDFPELNISIQNNENISISVLGEVQKETVKELINRRFGLDIKYGRPRIQYMETIEAPVKGTGHYEPLRHFAEVHLLLEPLERGSGIIMESIMSGDDLDFNRQSSVIQTLKNHSLKGVLTGSPLTDVKITLIDGKDHLKHTEGGDFPQASIRAYRQALMKAKSILLEPIMLVEFKGPGELFGRISSDVKKLKGEILSQAIEGDGFIIEAKIPLSQILDYNKEYLSITSGRGSMETKVFGFEPCTNFEEIIEEMAYDPRADLDDSPDSVFCIKGSAILIPWDEADDMMSIKPEKERMAAPETERSDNSVSLKELEAIFQMTYGKKGERIKAPKIIKAKDESKYKGSTSGNSQGERHLIVDGYNVIFRWNELKELADLNMDSARESLIHLLANYSAYTGEKVTVVFDAYNSKEPGPREIEDLGITVVFTGENETADTYIEREAFRLGKKKRLRVATSDRLEQMNVFASGALRISALELKALIEYTSKEIREKLNG